MRTRDVWGKKKGGGVHCTRVESVTSLKVLPLAILRKRFLSFFQCPFLCFFPFGLILNKSFFINEKKNCTQEGGRGGGLLESCCWHVHRNFEVSKSFPQPGVWSWQGGWSPRKKVLSVCRRYWVIKRKRVHFFSCCVLSLYAQPSTMPRFEPRGFFPCVANLNNRGSRVRRTAPWNDLPSDVVVCRRAVWTGRRHAPHLP